MLVILRKLLNVRPGEEARTALMFVYSFLLIASLTIVKPVRAALFLSELGPEKLPYVYLLIAIATPAFVVLYSGASKRLRLNRLITATLLVSIAFLLLFWFALSNGYHAHWLIYSFYVWVSAFGLIVTTQFWLLANYVFNAREAKRLFGIIGSGAIAGGILGGYLTSTFAPALHTHGMLHLCYLFLAMCLLLQYIVWRWSARIAYADRMRREERQKAFQLESSPWRLLLQSRLVVYIGAIAGTGVLVGTLIDYQFSVVASRSITGSDQLASFFGFWLSNLSIVSLLFQVFVTGFLLKRYGVNTSLMFLPALVTAGSATAVLFPTLWAATSLKVGEGGLKQSLHKSALELLGLPVPARLKNQVKALIDVAVDNFATGLAGLVILLLVVIGFADVRTLGIVILVFAALWIVLVARAKSEYLDAFRQAIERRTIRPEDISYEIYSSMRADQLIELLGGTNDRQILMALSYLENMRDARLPFHLERLLDSSSSDVLRSVYRIARSLPDVDLSLRAHKHLYHNHPAVRVAATRYLLRRSDDKQAMTEAFLSAESDMVKAAAIVAAAREWVGDGGFNASVDFKRLLEDLCRQISMNPADLTVTKALAEALSIAPQPELEDCTKTLLRASSPDIVAFAALSAGRSGNTGFLDTLLPHLENRQLRQRIREAIAGYGDLVSERLAFLLNDGDCKYSIRLEIPRILFMIGTDKSFTLLSDSLNIRNARLRFEVLRSLNKMRSRDARFRLKSKILMPVVWNEIGNYYRLLQVHNCVDGNALLSSLPEPDPDTIAFRMLLKRAVEERLADSLERVFRLLGLRHSPKDMYHAYLCISGSAPDQRANAIELLELVIRPQVYSVLAPIIEYSSPADLAELGKRVFGIHITSEGEALSALLQGDDDWLRAVALHVCRRSLDLSCEMDVSEFETHGHFMVREAALKNREISALTAIR